jgi:hypothetical protein
MEEIIIKFNTKVDKNLIANLRKNWESYHLNNFDHIINFAAGLTCDLYEHPNVCDLTLIMVYHVFALDYFIQNGKESKMLDDFITNKLSALINENLVNAYKLHLNYWAVSTDWEKTNVNKLCYGSEILWSDWRQLNIGMKVIYYTLNCFINKNIKIDTLKRFHEINALNAFCNGIAILNDIASYHKDSLKKDELNYYHVCDKPPDDLDNTFATMCNELKRYEENLDKINYSIMMSIFKGNYINYKFSYRYKKENDNW